MGFSCAISVAPPRAAPRRAQTPAAPRVATVRTSALLGTEPTRAAGTVSAVPTRGFHGRDEADRDAIVDVSTTERVTGKTADNFLRAPRYHAVNDRIGTESI